MPYIETRPDIRIHYDETGSGCPIVLIHGWGMSAKVWKPLKMELAGRFRCISIELRGHGDSLATEGAGSLGEFSADIIHLLKHLQLREAVLVGWSLGGQIALEEFHSFRPHLKGVVLAGVTPRFTAEPGYDAGLQEIEVRGLLAAMRRDYTKAMTAFFRRMFAPGEVTQELLDGLVAEVLLSGPLPERAIAEKGLAALVAGDSRALLPSVDLPVLLINGDRDTICLPEAAEYMAKAMPKATLTVLPGCGHAPFLSHPEIFARLLTTFVEELAQ
jgi:pimeloyl-[acyl-carrier protein] methyl ester esterase